MFDDFLRNCKPEDEIKPSKKRVKKNVAALRLLIEKDDNSMTKRKFRLKPSIIVVIAVIAGLSVITGAASIIRHNGFLFEEGHAPGVGDYFVIITENAGDAPKTIEKLCYDNNLPAKYKQFSEEDYTPDSESVWMRYYDSEAGSGILTIIQVTKSSFVDPLSSEVECSPAEIKGHNGFKIVDNTNDDVGMVINQVMWDCGEYIHIVVGHNISMEEVMSIVDGMTEK